MDDPSHGPDDPIFEFDRMEDHIFLGTNACCRTHFEERLLSLGVSADISLESERIDEPYGVESFVWLPTDDHAPPTRDAAEIGIAALEGMLARGKKIYIHCRNGHGRAPTFYAAYLIRKRGMSPDDAISFVKGRRNGAHLEESQVEFLRSLA